MPDKKKKKKKIRKGADNVFDLFTQRQIAEFKEGFALMDHDKDGKIGPEDLEWTHKHVNLPVTDDKIASMIADSPTHINFTMLLNMFAERASGEQDDDDVVINGFKTFADADGKMDSANLRNALVTFADRFTQQEADDALLMFGSKDGYMDVNVVVKMLTGPAEDEEEENKEEE